MTSPHPQPPQPTQQQQQTARPHVRTLPTPPLLPQTAQQQQQIQAQRLRAQSRYRAASRAGGPRPPQDPAAASATNPNPNTAAIMGGGSGTSSAIDIPLEYDTSPPSSPPPSPPLDDAPFDDSMYFDEEWDKLPPAPPPPTESLEGSGNPDNISEAPPPPPTPYTEKRDTVATRLETPHDHTTDIKYTGHQGPLASPPPPPPYSSKTLPIKKTRRKLPPPPPPDDSTLSSEGSEQSHLTTKSSLTRAHSSSLLSAHGSSTPPRNDQSSDAHPKQILRARSDSSLSPPRERASGKSDGATDSASEQAQLNTGKESHSTESQPSSHKDSPAISTSLSIPEPSLSPQKWVSWESGSVTHRERAAAGFLRGVHQSQHKRLASEMPQTSSFTYFPAVSHHQSPLVPYRDVSPTLSTTPLPPLATTTQPTEAPDSPRQSAELMASKLTKQDKKKMEEEELQQILNNKEKLHQLLKDAVEGRKLFHNEIEQSQLTDMQLVARGAAAKVFKATYTNASGEARIVALKHYSREYMNFDLMEFRKEAALLSILSHKNLISCVGACTKLIDKLYLVTPFFPYTLSKFVEQLGDDMPKILGLANDIASAMQYLHSFSLIHRDLKSSNVLVSEDGIAKVIDFGTVRVVDRALMTGNLGTVQYMAPELFSSHSYTVKADVYSYAIVVWEMVTRSVPYEDKDTWAIPVSVCKGERPSIPKETHPELAKIIKKCWNHNPSKRPTFTNALAMLAKLRSQIRSQQTVVVTPPAPPPPPPTVSGTCETEEESVTINKELLDFSLVNDAFPLKTQLEDHFIISNNTHLKQKLKIDKISHPDFQIYFTLPSTVIEPKSYKKIQAKLIVSNKINTLVPVPIYVGDTLFVIEAIVRCEPSVFGIDPTTLEPSSDFPGVPRLLIALKSSCTTLLTTEGVFLVQPSSMRRAKELVNIDQSYDTLISLGPFTVAALIKLWFSELPQALFGSALLLLDTDSSVSKALAVYQQTTTTHTHSGTTPYPALATWLIQLLAEVASSPLTKTTPTSLAGVMAPHLFRIAATSLEEGLGLTHKSAHFVEQLITRTMHPQPPASASSL
ncbi:serine/threonine-protein kinase STY46 [Pelomyxa schiedti]|nr:serine/threonine-protein kinase STY46 [Pelomyxa schiedti]